MQTLTPAPASTDKQHTKASAALARLDQSRKTVSHELGFLPSAQPVDDTEADLPEQDVEDLLHNVALYWAAPSAQGQSRHDLFVGNLQQVLHDELTLKIYERDITPEYAACLPLNAPRQIQSPEQPPAVTTASLHVELNEQTPIEIKGALAMSVGEGPTLLYLPGAGLVSFSTRGALFETTARWLDDPVLRKALLDNADQHDQDNVLEVIDDPELFLEPFKITDIQLRPFSGNPFAHSLSRQLDKQRQDIRHACKASAEKSPQDRQKKIQKAIDMPRLFGPAAMLALRELAYMDIRQRALLPYWTKIAPVEDIAAYMERVKRYDEARLAFISTTNDSQSPEHFANVRLKTRLASDLGYDLNPHDVMVETSRTLPLTDETYKVSRSLLQLSLYGLHSSDREAGSAFMTRTVLRMGDTPLESTHPLLTPAYIARLIDELGLRLHFGEHQRKTFAMEHSQRLMSEMIRKQVTSEGYAAKMQGHISADDFNIVENMAQPASTHNDTVLKVQQIRLNGSGILGKILIFRKEDTQGRLERLIMFSPQAPRDEHFQGFHNETQLRNELVAWSASPQMQTYLLQQVETSHRATLQKKLNELAKMPYPEAGFMQLVTLKDYEAGLQAFVHEHVKRVLSENEQHTPAWYLQASADQRQELVTLEDAVTGAIRNYEAQPQNQVESFESYTHKRASHQIALLLKVPENSINPDHIIITSQRETRTYTQMLLKGYDDSIDFINTSPDTDISFSGPKGVDLRSLTAANIAGSVRGKWLADDYISQIKNTQLHPDSTGYDYRQKASLLITQLQMKAAALRSLLKGHISPQQYQWLRISLDNVHLSDQKTRTRYPLYPLQIHVDKPFIASGLNQIDQLVIPTTTLINVETVQGCIALLSTENRQPALLYTPKAPDEIEFRLFSSFTDSLSAPGMIDYYKDRCRVSARRTLSFFLRDMREGNANKAPFLPKESISDFARICFNRPLERKLRDVEETTAGRNSMLSRMIWNSIEIIAVILTLPFPPASFAVGAFLSMRDSILAIRALTGETPEAASFYIFASLLNSAGAAGDLYSGLKGFGGLMRKLGHESGPHPTSLPLTQPSRLPTYDELFPVSLQDEPFWLGKPNANGHAAVFRSGGNATNEVRPTGQYATKNSTGIWRPLEQAPDQGAPELLNQTSRNRVVNISLKDAPVMTSGHAKGIRVVNGEHYIELHGHVYRVQFDASMRHWNIIDPRKPYAFFGKQPVHLNENGQWQLLDRAQLRGGGLDGEGKFKPLKEEAASSSTPSTNLSDYELPQQMQPHIFHILNTNTSDANWMGIEDFFTVYYADMRKTYNTLRENLYRDSQSFFARHILPPKPALVPVDASTTVDTFFASVFANHNGLVLSEAPRSVASKRLLILNMDLLEEQKIEVLYIEHLFTDKHLPKLNKYRNLGKKTRSGSHEMKNHLEWLNEGALDNQTVEYDYYHLIKAAHRHNIEVRPFSSSVSYPVSGHPVASAIHDSTAAQKMSNFFGHKLINEDIERNASRRWIALLDQKLASTYQNVPGIAELEGVISVRIQDAPANFLPTIKADPGTYTVDGKALKSDFVLELGNPTIPHPSATSVPATPVDYRLLEQLRHETQVADVTYYTGEHGFRWDDATGWQRVDSQSWEAERPLTAIQRSLEDTAYEMPAETRKTLHELMYFEHKGVNEYYFFHDPTFNRVRQTFFTRRRQLQMDARSIVTSKLPPRATLPVIPPDTSASGLLEILYRHTDGIVIGESHSLIASKKLLIDNMPLLERNNVKTLYMEHLMTDLHQADLDRFFEKGHMSKSLLHDLRAMDKGHYTDPTQTYNFEKLVIRAREHGMEIRAIDSSTSYRLDGLPNEESTTRQQMMNYFASRAISKHQEVIGPHRWIALVGNSHSNTFKNVVPGIAELRGGIGLRVVEVEPGQAKPLGFDPGGHVRAQMSTEHHFIKGDYLVEIEVPTRPSVAIDIELLPAGKLTRPGMFMLEQGSDGGRVIIHRSRDTGLYRTPILKDSNGKLYVDRPSWTAVHKKLYTNIETLLKALKDMNLIQVI